MSDTATIALEVPDLEGLDRVSDGELIERMRAWGEARRFVDAGMSRLAAEVKARSSLELGHDGLAQRSGLRTPDALVSSVTGTSGPEARTMVAVGEMLDAPSPWLAEVASGVGAGEVSVGAAAAIQQGLGLPSADVAADDLADAAHRLVTEAATLPPEKVARRARELRDQLDADGVADREAMLRQKRFLRLTPLPDGMTRVSGLLDPESAALVTDAIDCVTSPRRGGPRFVDETQKARAEAIITDTRSTEQLTLDALVEMIRIAGAADPGRVFGTRKPGVRIHATVADLDRRTGCRTPRRSNRRDLHRHRPTTSLRRRVPPDPVRRLRPRPRPGTHPTPVHRKTAHRARRHLGRMRHPRLRPTTLLDRSPPRRRMGQTPRPHRCDQRGPALPPPPHVDPRPRPTNPPPRHPILDRPTTRQPTQTPTHAPRVQEPHPPESTTRNRRTKQRADTRRLAAPRGVQRRAPASPGSAGSRGAWWSRLTIPRFQYPLAATCSAGRPSSWRR